MVQRLLSRLDELVPRGSSVVGAFSGGADSTGLAVGLSEARRAGRLRPWLGHVVHGVRPGADDVSTLLGTAERLGLPLTVRCVPGGAIAGHRGVGVEEGMRRERYALLSETVDQTGAVAVLTGHHADDQAETVLGHLIRGAGLDGAEGMRRVTELTVPWWDGDGDPRQLTVVRPLLRERRAGLRRLVEERGLDVVDDATNREVDRTRAALRHEVLPALERIAPGATDALGRFAEIAGDVLPRAADGDGSSSVGTSADGARRAGARATTSGECDGLRDVQMPVVRRDAAVSTLLGGGEGEQRLAVRCWVVGATGRTPTLERVDAVRRWLWKGGGGGLQVGGGWSMIRRGSAVELRRDAATEGER